MTAVAEGLGSSLGREYYTSDDIFEDEIQRLWLANWRYFAHESELPKRGDFVARELLGENVVVVRQPDGSVAAFLNVCRHRGALICQQDSGNKRTLSCPYHAWTWSLDGKLLAKTAMEGEGDFEADSFPLWKVHVEVWRGLIYICLADERPAPIGPQLDAAIPLADKMRFEQMKQIEVRQYLHHANWKLGVENFSECYHCGPVHTLLPISMDIEIAFQQHVDADDGHYIRSGHYPKDGCVSFTRDGQYVCKKLFGAYGDGEPVPDHFGVGMVSQPDMMTILFQSDYGVIQEFLPVAKDRTLFITRWFVNSEAVEGEDYDVDTVVDVWHVTNAEDHAILDTVQQGVSSRRYTPGPLERVRESGNRTMFDAYHRAMADSRRGV